MKSQFIVVLALGLVLNFTARARNARASSTIGAASWTAVRTSMARASSTGSLVLDGTGSTTYWSNDGSSVGGGQPTIPVTLNVTKGLYSVLLGDTTIPHMTTAVPAAVFTNGTVYSCGLVQQRLRASSNGPDQRLAMPSYACRRKEECLRRPAPPVSCHRALSAEPGRWHKQHPGERRAPALRATTTPPPHRKLLLVVAL